jgi:protein involved in ribonucleotide reduction
MAKLVYYSSQSGNTESFIHRLGVADSVRIPIAMKELVSLDDPYVLFIPTYAANDGRGALPKSVVKFLNHEPNRLLLKGVIASGNINFGTNYCLGGFQIAQKCNVPLLYRYELRGTSLDITNVRTGLEKFWNNN